MHLTPEEQKIGKENFQAAIGSELTRREFLQGSLAAATAGGIGLGAHYFAYKKVENPVRVGVIGTGDEGSVLIGAHTPDYLQVVAIADIRPYNVHRAFHGDEEALAQRPGLMAKYDWKSEDQARAHVKVYDRDYGDLLKDPNVEAVIIALPLHLHAQAAIAALRAGKHVLTEKLMGHSVHECKEMGRVAKQTGLLLATGHQRHYSILYDNAVETIRQGLIGKIHHIRAQWHRGNMPGKDSWQQPLPSEAMYTDLLALRSQRDAATGKAIDDLSKKIRVAEARLRDAIFLPREDAERFLAHEPAILEGGVLKAEDYGYAGNELKDHAGKVAYKYSALEELIRWRLWNRTGGGLMAELGSHQLDASSIFISADYARQHGERVKVQPLSVSAVGGRHIFPLDRDADDHVYCSFEFPGPEYYQDYKQRGEVADPEKKIVVTYSSINGNGLGGHGETVLGTDGTLMLEREQEVLLFKGSNTTTNIQVAKAKGDGGATLSTTDSGGGAAAALGQSALVAGPVSRGYTEEMEHFAWCLRNRGDTDHPNLPRCHPPVALADAVIALTSNIAIRDKRRIEFKPEWFDIDSDETPEGEKPNLDRYKV